MPCYYCAIVPLTFLHFFFHFRREKAGNFTFCQSMRMWKWTGKKMFLKDDGSLCYLDHNEITAL